jgi:Tol biopolymer transport system component
MTQKWFWGSAALITALLLAVALAAGAAAQKKPATAEELLGAALHQEEVEGNLERAIATYKKVVAEAGANRALAARALVRMGQCYEKLGNAEARKAYERVVREFADQPESSKVARERLSALAGGGRAEVAMRRVWVAGRDQPVGISADGRYAVFVAQAARDLWLRDLQSGEQRRITKDASWVEFTFASGSAAISPDGKRVAYGWWVRSCGELRVSALDGSSMRVLRPCQLGETMSVRAWMPDSRRILAISYDPKDQTYRRHMISLPDGAIRDIGQPEPGNVSWGYPSPDGRHIAYGLKGDIFVYDTATEQDSVLVQNPAWDSMLGWTPDGSGILFLSNRSGTRDLYLLGIENGRPRGDPQLLRRDLGNNTNLYLTRDGRLFRRENTGTSDSFIVPVDEQTGKLTGTPSPVDANYPEAWYPAWSPDGKLLYYSMSKGPSGNRSQVLVIRSEETGQTREITPKPKLSRFWYPVLSPDERRFAVAGEDQSKNFGVFAIDAESGDVTQLAKIPLENEPVVPCPNWSPDGKAIFYKVRSLEKSEGFIIRRKDLATGEEKDVHRGIHTRDMKISPDGTRFVYFRTDRPTKSHVLGILDIQSGKELELWRVPEADSPDISGPTWAPDGKHVLVARSLKQGSELWRFPAAGGPGEKLHFSPESAWGFVMHPSGKRMAFTQSRTNYELWVLENFLPGLKAKKQ